MNTGIDECYMEIPDVMGFTLAQAKKLLSDAGLNICAIKVTFPPRCECTEYDDSFRVIRSKIVGNQQIELLICNPKLVLQCRFGKQCLPG